LGKGRGCVSGLSPKQLEQLHLELVHLWLLVHSNPTKLPVEYYSLNIVSRCVKIRFGIVHLNANQMLFNIFTAIICLPSLLSVDCTCNTRRLCDHGDFRAAFCFANPFLKKPRQ